VESDFRKATNKPDGDSDGAGFHPHAFMPKCYRNSQWNTRWIRKHEGQSLKAGSSHGCHYSVPSTMESHSVADGDESLPGHIAGITNNNILVVIMKIAIARDGNLVSGHFGHCKGDILFTVRKGKLQILHNRGGHRCRI